MSYMWGIVRGKRSARIIAAADRICKQEGGHGVDGGNIPGTGYQYWFCGPNRGEPFDRDLAHRVNGRVEREVPEYFTVNEIRRLQTTGGSK